MRYRVRFYRADNAASYWSTGGWYSLQEARDIRTDAWKYGLSADVIDEEGFIH